MRRRVEKRIRKLEIFLESSGVASGTWISTATQIAPQESHLNIRCSSVNPISKTAYVKEGQRVSCDLREMGSRLCGGLSVHRSGTGFRRGALPETVNLDLVPPCFGGAIRHRVRSGARDCAISEEHTGNGDREA